MGVQFDLVDEWGTKTGYGLCRKAGFRRAMPGTAWRIPVSYERIEPLEPQGKRLGGTLGGAAAGALAAGPVGALVGAMAFGNSNRVYFKIKTVDGTEALGRISKLLWPSMMSTLDKAIIHAAKRQAR